MNACWNLLGWAGAAEASWGIASSPGSARFEVACRPARQGTG